MSYADIAASSLAKYRRCNGELSALRIVSTLRMQIDLAAILANEWKGGRDALRIAIDVADSEGIGDPKDREYFTRIDRAFEDFVTALRTGGAP